MELGCYKKFFVYFCNSVALTKILMILTNQKPDNLGIIASTLCVIHCISTPFFFIAQVGSARCCDATPLWWGCVDFFFLIISFLAIYRATQKTLHNWMKHSLWLCWFLMFVLVLNEKIAWIPLHENLLYFSAVALIVLHFYNKKYCQYNTTKCATNER